MRAAATTAAGDHVNRSTPSGSESGFHGEDRAGAALYSYVLPLREALVTGRGTLTRRRGLLVCLRDRHGRTGWGEAAPLPGWSGPDPTTTGATLAAWLRAAVPFEEPDFLGARADETLREVPCAWAAIGGAAADLAARRRGVPLASFLAGQAARGVLYREPTGDDRSPASFPVTDASQGEMPRVPTGDDRSRPSSPAGEMPTPDGSSGMSEPTAAPVESDTPESVATACPAASARWTAGPVGSDIPESVATAALIHGDNPESVAAAATAATAAGHTTLKLKVGSGPITRDVARVAALRDAAPAAALRLDANGAWGTSAGDAVRALRPFEPELIEEPCRGLAQLRRLQESSDIPIAADESLPPLAEMQRRLPLGVAAAVLKPSALGGPGAVLRAAAALANSGTAVIIGSFLESAVGVATAAHVAAAGGGPPAGLGTSALLGSDVCEPPLVQEGAVWLPAGPGLGLAPEFDAIQLVATF